MCVPHTFTTSITEASTPAIALSHFHLVKEPSGRKTQTAATVLTDNRSSLDSSSPVDTRELTPARTPHANGATGGGVVELSGIEPLTSCVQGRRSPS